VVFIGVVEGIAACEQLALRVRSGPLAVDLNFPYHPHVTVAHDLDDQLLDKAFSELSDFDCVFEAASFHLYEHDDLRGWQPTESFELTGLG
jgi:2'-5' RNA ligase